MKLSDFPRRGLASGIAVAVVATAVAAMANDRDAGGLLPGMEPLALAGPLDEVMVAGIDRWLSRRLAEAPAARERAWSPAAGGEPEARRDRLREIIGAVDPRVDPAAGIEEYGPLGSGRGPEAAAITVRRVRYEALDGVSADGLWIAPREPRAVVIALADAAWTPEQFAGLAPGVPAQACLPRRLAERGAAVFVPTVIDRGCSHSGSPAVGFTNQPRREFIARMAFVLGRTVLGFEVQKVLAGVDRLAARPPSGGERPLAVGVCGVGDGGLVALAAAAAAALHGSAAADAARVRERLWRDFDASSPAAATRSADRYRRLVHETVIGRQPAASVPPRPRCRRIIDDAAFTGFEVAVDVQPDVIAAGILLVPRGIPAGQRRPLVVCQHGLEDTPHDTLAPEGEKGWAAYKSFAAALARRGYVVYAPQNPYRGADRFRVLQRKANPLGLSLFSFIVAQHERTLDVLTALHSVAAERIGFYGLSYGGKTALRVPALEPRYALAICSGDFNDWVRKVASVEHPCSYVFHGEYEIAEWNLGHVANYAELAWLIAPRPFMVERGHRDGCAPDDWVAAEYARARLAYVRMGIPERTEIEWFDGPHTIHGVGTFQFLDRFLRDADSTTADPVAAGDR